MTNQEKMNRRVDVSANISDYVYDYEKAYTKALKDSNRTTNPMVEGSAAIAVYDS